MAEATACRWLAGGRMPEFAAAQLSDLRSAMRVAHVRGEA
jgi:hypothetical protein